MLPHGAINDDDYPAYLFNTRLCYRCAVISVVTYFKCLCLQCFDAVGWVVGL